MSLATVESLWRYPITGGPGISVEKIDVMAGGFVGDRNLLLAEESETGLRRIGSKQAPDLFEMRYMKDGRVVLLGKFEVDLPEFSLDITDAADGTCDEFGDPTPVHYVGSEYDDVFSNFLGRDVRLLRKSARWILGEGIPSQDRANASLHVI